MPTIFSHAAVGAVASRYVAAPGVSPRRLAAWSAFCAILPDFDVLGIPGVDLWNNAFAHRGFTHSIVFALLTGALMATLLARGTQARAVWFKLGAYFAVVTLSHPLLDMLTNGGPGVQLFAPFSDEGFFFPWRPIEVSPLGTRFFSARAWAVLASELLWIGLPLAALLVWRRWRRPSSTR